MTSHKPSSQQRRESSVASSSLASSQTSVSRSTFASNIAPFTVTNSPMPRTSSRINNNTNVADAVRQVFGASLSPKQDNSNKITDHQSSSALVQQSQLPSTYFSDSNFAGSNTRNNHNFAIPGASSSSTAAASFRQDPKTHIRHNLPTAKPHGDPFSRINQHDYLFDGPKTPALNQNSVPSDKDLYGKVNSPERNSDLYRLHQQMSVVRSNSPVAALMSGASYRHTKASLARLIQNMKDEDGSEDGEGGYLAKEKKPKAANNKNRKSVSLNIPGMSHSIRINNNNSFISDSTATLQNSANLATATGTSTEDQQLQEAPPVTSSRTASYIPMHNQNTATATSTSSSSLLQNSGITLNKSGLEALAGLQYNHPNSSRRYQQQISSSRDRLPKLGNNDENNKNATTSEEDPSSAAAASPISLEDLAGAALDRIGTGGSSASLYSARRRPGQELINYNYNQHQSSTTSSSPTMKPIMNVGEFLGQNSARGGRDSARGRQQQQHLDVSLTSNNININNNMNASARTNQQNGTPRGLKVLEKLQHLGETKKDNSTFSDQTSHIPPLLYANMRMQEKDLHNQLHPVTNYSELHKDMDKIYGTNSNNNTTARNNNNNINTTPSRRTTTPSRTNNRNSSSSTPTRRGGQTSSSVPNNNNNQRQEAPISLSNLNSTTAMVDKELSEFERSLQMRQNYSEYNNNNINTSQSKLDTSAVSAASQLFVRTIGSDTHEASMSAMADGSKQQQTHQNSNNNKQLGNHLSKSDVSKFNQRKSSHAEFGELYHQCEELWSMIGTGLASRERASTALFPMLFSEKTSSFSSTTQLASYRQTIMKYLKKLQTQHDLTEAANEAMVARDSTIFDIVAISKRYSEYCRHTFDSADSWRDASSKLGAQAGSQKRYEESNSVAVEATAIKHELRVALHKYRICTLFAIEAIAKWMEFTGRVDFWWRGRPALIAMCTDLHQAAFSRRPLLYLLGFDVVHNPFVLPGDKWFVVPKRDRRMMNNSSPGNNNNNNNNNTKLSSRMPSVSISDPRRKDGEAQNFVLVNEYGVPLQHEKAQIVSNTRASLLSAHHQSSSSKQPRGKSSSLSWSQSSTTASSQQQRSQSHQSHPSNINNNINNHGSRAWSSTPVNPNIASQMTSNVAPFWRQMESDEYEYKTRMESGLHLLRHAVLQCIVPIQSSIRGFLARKHFRREYILVRILQNHLRAFVQKLEIERARRFIATRELARVFHGFAVRSNFARMRKSVIRLQSWFRGISIRGLLSQQQDAVVTIQQWVRPIVRKIINTRKREHRRILLLQRTGRSYLNRFRLCKWAWSRISAKRKQVSQLFLVERELRFGIERSYLESCVSFGGSAGSLSFASSAASSSVCSASSSYFSSLLRKDELESLPGSVRPRLSPLAAWAQASILQSFAEFSPILSRILILANYEEQIYRRKQLLQEESNERIIVLGGKREIMQRTRMVDEFFVQKQSLMIRELEPLSRSYLSEGYSRQLHELYLSYESCGRLSEFQKLEQMRRQFIIQSEIDERFAKDISPLSTWPKCELIEKEERRRIMGVAAETFSFEFLTMIPEFESAKRKLILGKWREVVGFFSSDDGRNNNKNNRDSNNDKNISVDESLSPTHRHLQQNIFSTIMSPNYHQSSGDYLRSGEFDDDFNTNNNKTKIAFQIEQLHLSSQENILRDQLQREFLSKNNLWEFFEVYWKLLKNMNRQLNILYDSEAYSWVKLMSWDGISKFDLATPANSKQKNMTRLENFDLATPDFKQQKPLPVALFASDANDQHQQEQTSAMTPIGQQVRWGHNNEDKHHPLAALHILASLSPSKLLQERQNENNNNNSNNLLTQFTEVSLASANPVLFRALIIHALRLQRIGRAFIARKGILNLLHQEHRNRNVLVSDSIQELYVIIEEVKRDKIAMSEADQRQKRTNQIRLALGLVDALVVKKTNYRLKRLATKAVIFPALANFYNRNLRPQLEREQRNFFEAEARQRDHVQHSEEMNSRTDIVHACLISAEKAMTATIRRRWVEHEDLLREAQASEVNHERRERVLQDRIYELLMKNENDKSGSRSEANRQLAREIAETERIKEQMWGRARAEEYYAKEEKNLLIGEKEGRKSILAQEDDGREEIGRDSAQMVFLSICSPPRGVPLTDSIIRGGSRPGLKNNHQDEDNQYSVLSPDVRSYNRFLTSAEEQKLLSPQTLSELRPKFFTMASRDPKKNGADDVSSPKPLLSPERRSDQKNFYDELPKHNEILIRDEELRVEQNNNNKNNMTSEQRQNRNVKQADEDFGAITNVQFESIPDWTKKSTSSNQQEQQQQNNLILNMTPIQKDLNHREQHEQAKELDDVQQQQQSFLSTNLSALSPNNNNNNNQNHQNTMMTNVSKTSSHYSPGDGNNSADEHIVRGRRINSPKNNNHDQNENADDGELFDVLDEITAGGGFGALPSSPPRKLQEENSNNESSPTVAPTEDPLEETQRPSSSSPPAQIQSEDMWSIHDQQNTHNKNQSNNNNQSKDNSKHRSESPQPQKPPLHNIPPTAIKTITTTSKEDNTLNFDSKQVAVGSAVSLSRSRSVDSKGRPITKIVKKVAVLNYGNQQTSSSASPSMSQPRNRVDEIEGFEEYSRLPTNQRKPNEISQKQEQEQEQEQQLPQTRFLGKARTAESDENNHNNGETYLTTTTTGGGTSNNSVHRDDHPSSSLDRPTSARRRRIEIAREFDQSHQNQLSPQQHQQQHQHTAINRPHSAGQQRNNELRHHQNDHSHQPDSQTPPARTNSQNVSLMSLYTHHKQEEDNDEENNNRINNNKSRGIQMTSGRIRPTSAERNRQRQQNQHQQHFPQWNENTDRSQREDYNESEPLPPVASVTALPGLGALRQMVAQKGRNSSNNNDQYHHPHPKSLSEFIANEEQKTHFSNPVNAHVAARNNIDSHVPAELSKLEQFAGKVSASIHRSHQRNHNNSSASCYQRNHRNQNQNNDTSNNSIYAEHQPKDSDFIRNDFGGNNTYNTGNNSSLSISQLPSLRQSPIRQQQQVGNSHPHHQDHFASSSHNTSTVSDNYQQQHQQKPSLLRRASDVMTEQEMQFFNDITSPNKNQNNNSPSRHHQSTRFASAVEGLSPARMQKNQNQAPGMLFRNNTYDDDKLDNRRVAQNDDDNNNNSNSDLRSILAQYTTLTLDNEKNVSNNNNNDNNNSFSTMMSGVNSRTGSPTKKQVKFAPGTKQFDESTTTSPTRSRSKNKLLRNPSSPISPSSKQPAGRVLPMPNADGRMEEAKVLQTHSNSFQTKIPHYQESQKSLLLKRASEVLTPPREESHNSKNDENTSASSPASRTHHGLSPPVGVPSILALRTQQQQDRMNNSNSDNGSQQQHGQYYHRNKLNELFENNNKNHRGKNNNKDSSPPGIAVHSPSPPKIVLQSPSVPSANGSNNKNNSSYQNESSGGHGGTSLLSAKYRPDLPLKEYFK